MVIYFLLNTGMNFRITWMHSVFDWLQGEEAESERVMFRRRYISGLVCLFCSKDQMLIFLSASLFRFIFHCSTDILLPNTNEGCNNEARVLFNYTFSVKKCSFILSSLLTLLNNRLRSYTLTCLYLIKKMKVKLTYWKGCHIWYFSHT